MCKIKQPCLLSQEEQILCFIKKDIYSKQKRESEKTANTANFLHARGDIFNLYFKQLLGNSKNSGSGKQLFLWLSFHCWVLT